MSIKSNGGFCGLSAPVGGVIMHPVAAETVKILKNLFLVQKKWGSWG